MVNPTIADAVIQLTELHILLDNAYWEASNLESKDQLYNLVSMISAELTELSKVSTQDHDMPYEPITSGARSLKSPLVSSQQSLSQICPRQATQDAIGQSLAQVISLFS